MLAMPVAPMMVMVAPMMVVASRSDVEVKAWAIVVPVIPVSVPWAVPVAAVPVASVTH